MQTKVAKVTRRSLLLRDAIETANANENEVAREVVQHGATLGVGLAAMATGNEQLYALLRNTMYNDSAVAGEALPFLSVSLCSERQMKPR